MNDVQLRVGDMLYAALKRWKMIVAMSIIGCVCGFVLSGISYVQGSYTSYEVSCSVALTSQSATGAFTGNSNYLNPNDFYLAQDLVDAAMYVMKSKRVLQGAIDRAGLVSVSVKEVSNNLTVERYNETQVLELTLSWNTADGGERLMRSILDTCKEVLPETLMVGSVSVIDEPAAQYQGGSGGFMAMGVLFGVLGFLAGVGVTVLELIMRPTLLTLRDVEDVLGLETLGVIPQDIDYFRHNSQLLLEGKEDDSEVGRNFASTAYILSNRFGTKEKHHCFYVTSTEDGEGKSTVAAHLAMQLSDMEKRTLLLDLNTRNPVLGGLFLQTVDYSRTLNALYKGESTPEEAVISLTGHLDLLPTVLERNAIPLDGALFEFIEALAQPYEYVIIDAPSTGNSSDVLRLNQIASTVLFVVRYDMTPLPAVQDAIDKLDKSGVRILGCVVNASQPINKYRFQRDSADAPQTATRAGRSPGDAMRSVSPYEEELFADNLASEEADWMQPMPGGSKDVMEELTGGLYPMGSAASDDRAMQELLRMGADGSWKAETSQGKEAVTERDGSAQATQQSPEPFLWQPVSQPEQPDPEPVAPAEREPERFAEELEQPAPKPAAPSERKHARHAAEPERPAEKRRRSPPPPEWRNTSPLYKRREPPPEQWRSKKPDAKRPLSAEPARKPDAKRLQPTEPARKRDTAADGKWIFRAETRERSKPKH